MHGDGFVNHSSERPGYPWALWCPCWPRYSRAKAPLGALQSPTAFQPFLCKPQRSPEFGLGAALCDPDHDAARAQGVRGSSPSASSQEALHM